MKTQKPPLFFAIAGVLLTLLAVVLMSQTLFFGSPILLVGCAFMTIGFVELWIFGLRHRFDFKGQAEGQVMKSWMYIRLDTDGQDPIDVLRFRAVLGLLLPGVIFAFIAKAYTYLPIIWIGMGGIATLTVIFGVLAFFFWLYGQIRRRWWLDRQTIVD